MIRSLTTRPSLFPSQVHRRVLTTRSSRTNKSVLVVPGYLLDASDFIPLVQTLRESGYKAALPPIRWYNWLPTVGGRSLRPILDRIDYAARALAQGEEVCEENGYEIQFPTPFTPSDWLTEFLQPRNGAACDLSESEEGVCGKIAIVGSSAGGWMSRIFLGSGPAYHGRIYNGKEVVHTLITLGSPHICDDRITKKNLTFVNTHYPGAHEANVKYVCVAGKATKGKSYVGGLVKDFVYQSYEMCCSSGEDWGDGVTPIRSALSLSGATHLVLEDVFHAPFNGHQWYGSKEVVQNWIHFLDDIF